MHFLLYFNMSWRSGGVGIRNRKSRIGARNWLCRFKCRFLHIFFMAKEIELVYTRLALPFWCSSVLAVGSDISSPAVGALIL